MYAIWPIGILAIRVVYGDLPVHCEMNSLVGEWQFWVTKPNDLSAVPGLPLSMDGTAFCLGAAGRPTMNSDLMSEGRYTPVATPGYTDSFKVGLAKTQLVHMRGTTEDYDRHELIAREGDTEGRWSMIFDEGFEVRIGTRSYLAISRYTCSAGTPEAWCLTNQDAHENSDGSVSGWDSVCGETFVGWYHDTDPVTEEVVGLGCWFGKRTAGLAPSYLLAPVEVTTSFAQRSRLRQGLMAVDSIRNACDIDEGIEDMNIEAIPSNFSWRDQYSSISWQTPITAQVRFKCVANEYVCIRGIAVRVTR